MKRTERIFTNEENNRSGGSALHLCSNVDSYLGASNAGVGQHGDEFYLFSRKLSPLVLSQTAQQSVDIH